MLKVVKRPKEYIAIKVPEDCEDVGKFVIKEAKAAGIHFHIATTYYDHADKWVTKIDTRDSRSRTVNPGSVIVVPDFADEYSASVMTHEDFDNLFKPVDEPVKASPIVVDVDAKPILDRLKEIKAEMSTMIEGVELPARPGFSEPFIAKLDKALNDYHQKQGEPSQRTSTPHVRIEFDDINDVPHVWIDGKYISSFPDHGLVRLNIEWNADDEHVNPKHYYIEYLNGEDTNPYQYTGIGQTNETDE